MNIEDRFKALVAEVKSGNYLDDEVMADFEVDIYNYSGNYREIYEKNPELGTKALALVLDSINESEMYHQFTEYQDEMLETGLDKERLLETASNAAYAAMDDEDCDMVRDLVNFIASDLNQDGMADDIKSEAIERCCPEDEYDWS